MGFLYCHMVWGEIGYCQIVQGVFCNLIFYPYNFIHPMCQLVV